MWLTLMFVPSTVMAQATATAPAKAVPTVAGTPEGSSAGKDEKSGGAAGTLASAGSSAPADSASPFGLAVGLSESVGLGTFVANPFARTPTVGTTLTLNPSVRFTLAGKKMVAAAKWSGYLEHTKPDNAMGRSFAPTDVFLTVSLPAVATIPGAGISVSPGVRYTVPVSYESSFASSRGTSGLSVVLARSLYGFDLSYTGAVNKGFFGYTSKVATAKEALLTDDQGRRVIVCREGEQFCGSAGMNTQFSFSNILAVGFNLSSKMSVSATYVLINGFRYAATETIDEFTPRTTDTAGNPVAKVGRGRADSVWGIVEMNYTLTSSLSVNAGIATVGPPKTADSKGYRFPFFDLLSPASNLTSYSLGVNGTF